jgi:hypothetical protein
MPSNCIRSVEVRISWRGIVWERSENDHFHGDNTCLKWLFAAPRVWLSHAHNVPVSPTLRRKPIGHSCLWVVGRRVIPPHKEEPSGFEAQSCTAQPNPTRQKVGQSLNE